MVRALERHLGSFDRSKCKGPLNGPNATGKHCPEGWTLYPLPGPQLGGITDNGSGETPYYAWVDQHNTFGLGNDVPFATGNQNDPLIALVDGKPLNLVVPYPMGFWAKALDGSVSTTRMAAGRAAASGRTPAPAPRSTSKAARARRRRSCTSRCVLIRSRTDPDVDCFRYATKRAPSLKAVTQVWPGLRFFLLRTFGARSAARADAANPGAEPQSQRRPRMSLCSSKLWVPRHFAHIGLPPM